MSSPKVSFAQSPLLASRTPLWRSRFLLVAMGLAFTGLGVRAAWVQIIHQDFYQRQGEVRFARTIETPAQRGRLLDRSGVVLADNVPATSVWAIPEDVNKAALEQPEKLAELTRIVGMPLADLQKKLADEDRSFVWLRRGMSGANNGGDVTAAVQALNLSGVYTRTETRRQYPEGESATQLTGTANADGKGIEGFELTFNDRLSGTGGSRRVIKDRMGRVVEDIGDQVLPTPGQDVSLTIDNKVQFFAYQQVKDAVLAHRAKGGSAVVLDVATGEVLALVNFDNTSSKTTVRNRALVDSFEPGSVMKPLTIALALERGLVTPGSIFQTAPGSIMVGSAKITDSHAHGVLTVNQIIQKSSNVGTVKIALQLPAASMWEFYSQVGLGQKPALPFPGIVSGRLRNPKSWQRVEQATMSYGYGLSVSLFQLAQAYSVLANDGVLIAPSIVRKAATAGTSGTAATQQVVSAKTAGQVRAMLQMAAGEGGTAPLAQVEGYTVGGKTGTSHKTEGKGYAAKKYRSTFVGMSPANHPRIVVAVSIDEPSAGKYFGGEVAAPVFAKTVSNTLRLLGVAPDRAVKPQFAVAAVEESI